MLRASVGLLSVCWQDPPPALIDQRASKALCRNSSFEASWCGFDFLTWRYFLMSCRTFRQSRFVGFVSTSRMRRVSLPLPCSTRRSYQNLSSRWSHCRLQDVDRPWSSIVHATLNMPKMAPTTLRPHYRDAGCKHRGSQKATHRTAKGNEFLHQLLGPLGLMSSRIYPLWGTPTKPEKPPIPLLHSWENSSSS